MSQLRIKPKSTNGKTHDVTIANAKTALSADWGFVGFGLYKLKAGESTAENTDALEVILILVLVEGKAEIKASEKILE